MRIPRDPGRVFEPRVLEVFTRKRRHVLLGEICLETGYRIDTVEFYMEPLVDRGAVRYMSRDDNRRARVDSDAVGYVLLDERLFTTGSTW